MKYRFLIIIFLIGVFTYLVFGQGNLIPPGIQNIYGPFSIISCSETDNGLNIFQQGVNSISFNGTNGNVQNLSGSDYCVSNDILGEGLCGSWIDNNFGTTQWKNSAFTLEVNCSASNFANTTFLCSQGACVKDTSNLPDLMFSGINRTYILNSNSTSTISYNVTVWTFISNFGRADAGPFNTIVQHNIYGIQDIFIPSILAGQTLSIFTYYSSVPPNLFHNITSKVDVNRTVHESNENNNVISVSFNVP